MFDAACAGCAATLQRKRLPWTRHPATRIAKIALLVSVVATAVSVPLLRKETLAPWALRERAFRAYQDGRLKDAVKDLEACTAAAPSDADAWLNLAVIYQELGLAPDVSIDAARRATLADPTHYRARLFLATAEFASGRFDASESECDAAVACRDATADAFRLRARLELRKPRPDFPKTIRAIQEGIARSPTSADLRVLLAEVHLQQHGAYDSNAYPPDVLAALVDARRVLELTSRTGADEASFSVLKARLLLASGESAEAFALATDALRRLPLDARSPGRVALQLVAGQGAWAWKQLSVEANTQFSAALAADPSMETAATISRFLVRHGAGDVARALLSSVPSDADPDGAVSAVLAALHADGGAYADAATAIAAARTKRPSDAGYAILDGDICAARGDLAGARAAYSAAEQASPGNVATRLRRVLLVLRDDISGDARTAALRSALAEVVGMQGQAEAPRDVAVATAIARLHLALGDPRSAREGLSATLAALPGSAEAWLLLGHACSAEGDALMLERAASAFARARTLEPQDVSIRRAEAEALLAAGDATGALVAAAASLRIFPEDEPLLAARAQAYLRLEQWRDAAVDLRKLLERHPGDLGLLVRLASAETRAGNRLGAADALDRAYERGDETTRGTIERLRIQFGLTDVDAAIRELRARGASALLADLLYRRADFEGAIATARDVLVERPGDLSATTVLVFALLDAGGGSEDSVRAARSALDAVAPDAAPGAMLRGRVLIAEHRFDEAWTILSEGRVLTVPDPVYEFLLGEAAFRTDRLVEAVQAFQRAIVLGTAPQAVRFQIADRFAALAAKLPSRAEELTISALRLDSGCLPAVKLLGEALTSRRDYAAAAAVYERAVQGPRVPPSAVVDLRMLAAWNLVAAGNPALALLHLEQAARIAPDDARADLIAGLAHLAARREPEARARLEAYLAARPDAQAASQGLIECALLRGDPAAAMTIATHWIDAHPADARATAAAVDALTRAGYRAEAARLSSAHFERRPGDPSQALIAVKMNLDAGRIAEAESTALAFERAAAADQKTAARLLRAEVAVALPGQAQEALRISDLVAADPTADADAVLVARSLRAHALLRLGRPADALAEARALIDSPPPRWRGDALDRALQIGGAAAIESNDMATAAQLLTLAAERSPNDAVVLNNLAFALAEAPPSAERALEVATRATTIAPDNPNFWDTRGTCADRAGRSADAHASYREALRLYATRPAYDPTGRARTALRLADSLKLAGQPQAAREIAAEVSKFSPPPPAADLDRAARLAAEE